ncbi:MAG: type II secretion system protein GspD [Planctomycetota bacterium]|jgi:Flp pilus assembly secretin CpaC
MNEGWVKKMNSKFKKFSRTNMKILILIVLLMFALAGCGDFFAQKPTEIQSAAIIRELASIESPFPDPNASKPDIYKSPPKILEQIVGGVVEYKLVYFCKYHTSDDLKKIVHEQFATKLFDKKGKETKVNDYTVTSSAATNQLIIRCPQRDDISAVLEVLTLADIPPVQVKIECIVSELYADKTMDWETTVLIENLFGENVFLGGKLDDSGGVLPAFPGAALRDPARSLFGLNAGYVDIFNDPGHRVAAVVDLLESKGYLKILMNPTLEVLNGQTAKVSSQEHLPLQETFIRSTDSDFFETKTEYYDVVDSLQITPHVFADGYISLDTEIVMGARSIPEGVKQVPVVTERRISNKENRIREGESLLIGGIRKTEERSVIRGVPFLKDIPLISTLFSSKDSEERAVETLFILTPTISGGGIPEKEMMERVRKRRASPEYDYGWEEVFKDPLGFNAYTDHVEGQAAEAEYERFKAELDKAAAQEEVEKVKDELLKAAEQVITEKAKAGRAQSKARKAQQEAEEAKQAFLNAQKETEKADDSVDADEEVSSEEKKDSKTEQSKEEKPKTDETKQSAKAKN